MCVGLIAALAALLPTAARAGNTNEAPVMQAIPPGTADPQVTKDGRFIFMIEPAPNNQKIMVTNGQPDQPYDDVGPAIYQTNGQKDRMVYPAALGGMCFYVDRGAPGDAFDDIGPAVISPDTSQLFYAAKHNGAWCPIINGQIGQPCDAIGTPVFSPNGKHLAYPIKNGPVSNLIVDGQPGPACDDVGTVVYSPNSLHLAYDSIQNKQHIVTFDGNAGPALDDILPGTPFFTSDNAQCVYFGKSNNQWTLYINNNPEPYGPYDNVTVPVFNSNNKHFMFVGTVNGTQALVYDGNANNPYKAIAPESLRFQPDVTNVNGPQFFYQATNNDNKQLTVLEHFEGPAYDVVVPSTLNFTVAGKDYYYWAQDGGRWLWRNDRHTVNDNQEYDDYKAGPNPFAADSKRTMYAVRTPDTKEKWQVIIDTNPLPDLYDDIDESQMFFTADAKHTIFSAKSNGAWKIVIDGIPGPDYASIVPGGGPVVQPNGTITYYAVKKNGSLMFVTYTN
jgi:hypothetical protein